MIILLIIILIVRKTRVNNKKLAAKMTKEDANIDPLSNENLLNYNTQGGEIDQVIL